MALLLPLAMSPASKAAEEKGQRCPQDFPQGWGVPRKSLWLFGTARLLLKGLSRWGKCGLHCAARQELSELERELVRVTSARVGVR